MCKFVKFSVAVKELSSNTDEDNTMWLDVDASQLIVAYVWLAFVCNEIALDLGFLGAISLRVMYGSAKERVLQLMQDLAKSIQKNIDGFGAVMTFRRALREVLRSSR